MLSSSMLLLNLLLLIDVTFSTPTRFIANCQLELVHLARALKHSSVDPLPAYQSTPSWLAQKANLPVLS